MSFDKLAKGNPKPLEPGIYYDLNREQYDQVPSLNQSILKKWIQMVEIDGGCPKQFKFWMDTRGEQPKGEALIMGSALDCLLLEPDEIWNKFHLIPSDAPARPTPAMRNAKAPKPESIARVAWWNNFEEESAGKDLIAADTWVKIQNMLTALQNDPKVSDIFQYCKKAVLQANIEGLPCKGEVDLFSEKTEFLFDLKTTRSAARKPFAKAAWQLGYHYQAAFYLLLAKALGIEKTHFCFVIVENEAPWCVAVRTLDSTSEAMQYALKQIHATMQPLHTAITRNQWPDFGDFEPIVFPNFATREAIDFLQD